MTDTSLIYENNIKMRHKTMKKFAKRFRGLMPVVVDVETAGLKADQNALLEVAAVMLNMNEEGKLYTEHTVHDHVEAFAGARLEKEALEITGIDPTHPFRFALPEKQALERLFDEVRKQLEITGCYRAVLVGHNAWFDLSFILAAAERSGIKHIPFHRFTTFDTATMAAVALGETVLARAMRRARIKFDIAQAHSAIYDAEKTAELFCHIVNNALF